MYGTDQWSAGASVSASAAENEAKMTLDTILPKVYSELHRLAVGYMSGERVNHTLQPTALVSEVYLQLATQHSVDFANRAQVLGVAAQMMRRILRKHSEKRGAEKRGGEATILALSDATEPAAASAVPFNEVDDLLDRLAVLNDRQAKVAECRIFGGLTLEETGEFLNISVATAHRDWACSRLWIMRELSAGRASLYIARPSPNA